MEEVVVIRTGVKYRGENWNGFVDGYFETVEEAEKYLEKQGYEFDYDDVYFKEDEKEMTSLAKIEGLNKIKPI